MSNDQKQEVSILAAGIAGRCPKCAKGALFKGYLTPVKRCKNCDLDLGFADSGDGPAIFIIFIVGFIIITLAMIVDNIFHPPAMIHLMLWIPLTIILAIALLRPFKGVMIALIYRNDAHEGRIE